jgi:hypothetical protein
MIVSAAKLGVTEMILYLVIAFAIIRLITAIKEVASGNTCSPRLGKTILEIEPPTMGIRLA